jgi:hypothetical protein
MNSVAVFRSRSGATSVRVSSGSNPAVTASIFASGIQEMISTATSAATILISSDRTAAVRRFGSRAEGRQRAEVAPAPSVEPIAPTPAEHSPDEPPVDGGAADPAPVPDSPQPQPFKAEKIELTVESLQNYDLLRPIPVVVETLGPRTFVAEIPDLDISTSGTSLSDTLILLKAQIATIYDGLRVKKTLDSERTRQLRLLESYIGKAKRNWF